MLSLMVELVTNQINILQTTLSVWSGAPCHITDVSESSDLAHQIKISFTWVAFLK